MKKIVDCKRLDVDEFDSYNLVVEYFEPNRTCFTTNRYSFTKSNPIFCIYTNNFLKFKTSIFRIIDDRL